MIKTAWLWFLDRFFPFKDYTCAGCERSIGYSLRVACFKRKGVKPEFIHNNIVCRLLYTALQQPKEEWS